MAKILLKKIKLENFKCYENTVISFKALSIIVGENNAGKSCLIEALRLVSRAAQGSTKRIYTTPPPSFELPLFTKGFVIDTKKLKIDLGIIIYYYNMADYAKVTAYFIDKSRIEIYLNNETALHIWERKEIENYLIVPEILYQYIPPKFNIKYENFLEILNRLLDEQRNNVFDAFSEQYRKDSKNFDKSGQWDIARCNRAAREFLDRHWDSLEEKIKFVSGKDFLSIIFSYFKINFGVTLSSKKIIDKLNSDTIVEEIKNFLEQLK